MGGSGTWNWGAHLPYGMCTTQTNSQPIFGGSQMNTENQATLYDVYLIYAEKLTEPIVKKASVIAKNEDDAKIKSGLMKEVNEKWDTDYLTFITNPIGIVTFKKKPEEVKIIKEEDA